LRVPSSSSSARPTLRGFAASTTDDCKGAVRRRVRWIGASAAAVARSKAARMLVLLRREQRDDTLLRRPLGQLSEICEVALLRDFNTAAYLLR